MSDLLSTYTGEELFAYIDPRDTLLPDPAISNGIHDELLCGSHQWAKAPSDRLPQSCGLLDDQLSSLNKPLPANIESILFSHDGPPSTQDNALSTPTAERYISPASLYLSPTSDNHEGAAESRSPSLERKETASSPLGRKPGRRASKVQDGQRERHLEKNRIAANKHRKKKKEFIQGLESRYDDQLSRKDQLKAEVSSLRTQALDLQEHLFTHAQCNNQPIQNYLNKKIGCLYAC